MRIDQVPMLKRMLDWLLPRTASVRQRPSVQFWMPEAKIICLL
jgi:hypothetical protein